MAFYLNRYAAYAYIYIEMLISLLTDLDNGLLWGSDLLYVCNLSCRSFVYLYFLRKRKRTSRT